MDRRRTDDTRETIIVRGSRWGRVASFAALGVLILLVIVIAVIWTERRPIATHYISRELQRRGVAATYHLDRVGFRTQEVSNLVIGDPRRPDLVARYARLQTRLKLDGSFEVYRIVARGVRLRGRLVHGRVSWGQVDKLLPPPSNKPFALPNFALDIADSSIALATPFGPVGLALQGDGQLSGGFKGRIAVDSPQLTPGKCTAVQLRANLAVAVVARHPNAEGPVTLSSFECPASRFYAVAPRFDAKTRFNESFTSVDGGGRMAISTLTAGANGLAAFTGDLTYNGTLAAVAGRVQLSAKRARLGTIFADVTYVKGAYRLGLKQGTFVLNGDFDTDSASLAPSIYAGVTQPLAAAGATPLGPIAKAMATAMMRTARHFDIDGAIRVVNFPGGGAARVQNAVVNGPAGAHARISGGSGVTYYWPAGALRVDTNIQMAGGGLPNSRVTLSQPRSGAPLSGVADLAPYSAGGERLALAPIRFGPGPGGSTALSTVALLDGSFPGGRVRALRLPITGHLAPGGGFAFGTSCAVVSFNYFQMSSLQLGPARLPVCPVGPAIILKRPSGPLLVNAQITRPVLNGSIGSSPLHLAAANGRLTNTQFAFNGLNAKFGKAESPIDFDAAHLTGNFVGSTLRGNFGGAKMTIGTVPILLSDASGAWTEKRGAFTIDGSSLVSDRDANPRFYPLKTNDLHLTVASNEVRANGSLHYPDTGTLVTDVSIEHNLATGSGHAILDVPGLTFGPNLQPDQLTRLTEGVIALVNGTITGRGRIDWSSGGKVSSSGDFSTASLDLAAPFGPVTGMSGTVHFNDLLALTTPPGQVMTVRSINPGILVENGVIRYQLLPHQLVKIERGEWPFMGGRLILDETVLNFARPTAKRLTFEVEGLDAHTFVQSLGFSGLEATGKFDGVLPMIFDESGGRIVGGRLDSEPPGGSLAYNGAINKADLGTMGNIAFNALKDLRFRSMIIRLDGDLAGEFTSRLAIDGVALGQSTQTQRIIRSLLAKLPIKLNVTISGPFRALIHMTKSFYDPREVIGDVLPRPLEDVPGITTEVRKVEDTQQQSQTPVKETVTPTSPPAKR